MVFSSEELVQFSIWKKYHLTPPKQTSYIDYESKDILQSGLEKNTDHGTFYLIWSLIEISLCFFNNKSQLLKLIQWIIYYCIIPLASNVDLSIIHLIHKSISNIPVIFSYSMYTARNFCHSISYCWMIICWDQWLIFKDYFLALKWNQHSSLPDVWLGSYLYKNILFLQQPTSHAIQIIPYL